MSQVEPWKNNDLFEAAITLGPEPSHDPANAVKISVERLSFWYGAARALCEVDLQIHDHEIIAFIGPSGSGKSTLLRCLNRTAELANGARTQGRVVMDGDDLYGRDVKPQKVRRRFGWIAQKPNPFASSIFENVSYGPKLHRRVSGASATTSLVERMLRRVSLWDEVKDRLNEPAASLSGGQQQRLCIARALAHAPEVILMDEPCAGLDPAAAGQIESLIDALRGDRAIVLITHNLQQAARLAQRVAVLDGGRIVEAGDAAQIFTDPRHPVSRSYIKGDSV